MEPKTGLTTAAPTPASAQAPSRGRQILVERVDFAQRRHAEALVDLLDGYARDPAGLGHGLPEPVKQALPGVLAGRGNYLGWIAWIDDEAVGLINAFEGISTFRAEPNLNLHDIVVRQPYRRQGIARRMLAAVETEARRRGCCKLTLEVLQDNTPALNAYLAAGFRPYGLDPRFGSAQFLEKKFYGD